MRSGLRVGAVCGFSYPDVRPTGGPITTADLKAGLVAAYAAGESPSFQMVLPGGTQELWKLAGVALVMPVIPAGAPADLEYALRLRRDTITSGSCPSCGASLTIDPLDDGAWPVPMGTALFNHRRTCPGYDEHAKKLLNRYLDRQSASSIEELYDAANKQTRDRIAPLKEQGASEIVSPAGEALSFEILERLMPQNEGQTCPHLRENPMQTWTCLIAEGMWRCDQCWAYHEVKLACGQSGLTTLEEHTCDLCRRYAPNSLNPLVLRINQCVMHGGACSGCMEKHSSPSNETEPA